MASITKRGEYSYQAVIRRRGFPSQTKTFETKSDAQKWARMVERDMDRGAWRDTSLADVSTLGDTMRRYLKDVTPAKRGADIEAIKINALLRDPICALKMTALSGKDIAAWRDRRLKKVKGSTVNREMAIISHAIEIARKEWGMNVENPCKYVRRPAGASARDRRLVGDEGRYLSEALDAVKSPFIKPMVLFALETGMRRSELLRLRWDNVNLQRRTALLRLTKNGTDRHVPLSSSAISILHDMPRSVCGNVFPVTMDAFKKAYSRTITRARTMYRNDCANAGLACDPQFLVGLRFHDLRHEATSRLFEKGLNVMEVASVTGHKTLQMLMRYTHLRAETLAIKLG